MGGVPGEYVDAPVRNLADGGATTESFVRSGVWARRLDEVRPADSVLIQFGAIRAGVVGRIGAARSIACIWDFSSTASTSAIETRTLAVRLWRTR
ncbi:hypothetical protein GCM10009789_35360 [Kribbella sancticallisti]|uniref:Uncharacterized protein n=1 Tax=Kribbella sancticallisti TaxID=460087 RepID=A0ABP4PDL8_9ACTN